MDAYDGKLSDVLKFALDDVRQRQKAIIDLVYAIDRQAMTLLGFSVTLSTATGSGAFALGWKVFGIDGDQRPIMVSAFFALATLAVGFVTVAAWCLTVMKSRKMGLPGKGAAFWKMAIAERWSEDWLAEQYLGQVQEADEVTLAGSREMARELSDARGLAVATFLLALGAAVLGPILQWLIV